MSETAETTSQEASPPAPEDLTARYASLLASGERVLLVRRRHWLTFLEAGRWFLLALLAAILSGALDAQVGNGGVSGVLSTVLGWATGVFLAIGVLGVGWYVIVWRVERYIVTTRRVIETGGVINKWSRDTSLEMITDMIVDHPLLGPDLRLRRDRPADRLRAGREQDPLPSRPGRLQEGTARREAGACARASRAAAGRSPRRRAQPGA